MAEYAGMAVIAAEGSLLQVRQGLIAAAVAGGHHQAFSDPADHYCKSLDACYGSGSTSEVAVAAAAAVVAVAASGADPDPVPAAVARAAADRIAADRGQAGFAAGASAGFVAETALASASADAVEAGLAFATVAEEVSAAVDPAVETASVPGV